MRLHIACGSRIIPGWVNLDLNRPPAGTKPFNALKPWPFDYRSVNAVYSEDFVEHLTQANQYRFFAEALRVLEDGGVHRINCPGAIWSLHNWIIRGDPAKDGLKAINLDIEPYPEGRRKIRHGSHHLLPTPGYLAEILDEIGYSSIHILSRDESLITGFPGDSRPRDDTIPCRGPNGNIYVEAVK